MKTCKWDRWGSFINWKNQNETTLKQEYNNLDDEEKELIEFLTFDDFCMGKWQRM